MRLDLSAFKYLNNDDFRVLTSIEMGMRNHEIVPVSLIESVAKIKRVNTNKVIANLLKFKLIEHSNLKYDGYSLNYIGYDYLAIHTLIKRGVLMRIGPKLGVGKESDVFICYVNPQAGVGTEISDADLIKLQNDMIVEFMKSNEDELNEEKIEENSVNENSENESEENSENSENESEKEKKSEKIINSKINQKIFEEEKIEEIVLEGENDPLENEENMRFDEEIFINDIKCKIAVIKLARLGRTSFRAVKNKRDYVKNKTHYNWLYLSRVSATNEFKYLNGLYNSGFSVPKPYDHNRHAILMDYIPSFTLSRIDDLGDKEKAFNELVSTLSKLATKGLIHGDFNEFNILVHMKTQKIFFIDFPQMISLEHEDAKSYFVRDIQCVNKFFYKKFGIKFDNNLIKFEDIVREEYLDIDLKAYGFNNVLKRLKNENVEIKNLNKLKNFEDQVEEEDELEEDLEDINIEEEKENKKKKKGIFVEEKIKIIDKTNNLLHEEDIEWDQNEIKNLNLEKIEKKNVKELNMKLSKDEIRDKVKRILVKQINNTGVKGKSNRFKSKKETTTEKE